MVGNLLRVTQEELDAILADSSILEARIYAEVAGEYPELVYLDKTWEGILYLLTGKSLAELEDAHPPLIWALFSGQLIDEEQDMGYDPAQYVTVEQVKQIDQALSYITSEELKNRYDGKQMKEKGIYPGIWEENDLDYVRDYFTAMKGFYRQAAQQNKAVITYFN
jgi:hypothetical protein